MAKVYDALRRRQVDGRHKDLPYPSLSGMLYHQFTIRGKLFAVDVAMGINPLHHLLRFIISSV